MIPLVLDDIDYMLAQLEYKDWKFHAGHIGDGFYIQCQMTVDEFTWHGRKWYVSEHSTKSEIIQTCLKAVLTAEEHEARESFLYHGRAIFSPHFDTDALLIAFPARQKRLPRGNPIVP